VQALTRRTALDDWLDAADALLAESPDPEAHVPDSPTSSWPEDEARS
jgi:hypothetical protein